MHWGKTRAYRCTWIQYLLVVYTKFLSVSFVIIIVVWRWLRCSLLMLVKVLRLVSLEFNCLACEGYYNWCIIFMSITRFINCIRSHSLYKSFYIQFQSECSIWNKVTWKLWALLPSVYVASDRARQYLLKWINVECDQTIQTNADDFQLPNITLRGQTFFSTHVFSFSFGLILSRRIPWIPWAFSPFNAQSTPSPPLLLPT